MLLSCKTITKTCFLFLFWGGGGGGLVSAGDVGVANVQAYWLWWSGERWVCIVWNFSVTGSRGRTAEQDQTWSSCCTSDSLLAYSLKIPLAKSRPLHYNTFCCKRIMFLRRRCRMLFTTANSSMHLQFFTGYSKHKHAVTQAVSSLLFIWLFFHILRSRFRASY
jgi:hypothetical protein